MARFKVGVIGGMGPECTVDFVSKVIALTTAKRDQEHVPMVIDHNTTVPDRTDAILSGSNGPMVHIKKSIMLLEAAGASVIAMPCNTAHYWYPQLSKYASVPMLNIIDLTVASAMKRYPKANRIGILATTGTIITHLYSDAIEAQGLTPVIAADQDSVMQAVTLVKAGMHAEALRAIRNTATHLRSRTDAIILGCTELPLILKEGSGKYVDSTLALAEETVRLFNRSRPSR